MFTKYLPLVLAFGFILGDIMILDGSAKADPCGQCRADCDSQNRGCPLCVISCYSGCRALCNPQ